MQNIASFPTVDSCTHKHSTSFSSPVKSKQRAGSAFGSLSVDLAVLIDLQSDTLLTGILGEIDHYGPNKKTK